MADLLPTPPPIPTSGNTKKDERMLAEDLRILHSIGKGNVVS